VVCQMILRQSVSGGATRVARVDDVLSHLRRRFAADARTTGVAMGARKRGDALTLVWFVVRNLGFGPFPALYV